MSYIIAFNNFMKSGILIIVFAFALVLSCTSMRPNISKVADKDEVIFYKDNYYDYIWKVYDDTVKVKKPQIIGLNGVYSLGYRLNAKKLEVIKHKQSSRFRESNEKGELLFQQTLIKEQRQKFERVMRQVNMETITDASSFTPTSVSEDGFRLQVELTKNGQQKKFEWDNIYVEDLVNLLIIANNVAPEKYKFYKDEREFVKFLKQ